MIKIYRMCISSCIALFFLFTYSISFSQTTNISSLTSLTLSNLSLSSQSDYLVVRVTGVGQVAATLTCGIRKTFDFGYIYAGAGSVPGQTIDFSSDDWTKNLVWQLELNINLKKAGDKLAEWWNSVEKYINSSTDINSNNSIPSK